MRIKHTKPPVPRSVAAIKILQAYQLATITAVPLTSVSEIVIMVLNESMRIS